ncbi:ROK family protein [Enterococcus sp. DIV0086]|uniref:ROK family protein n=1 Tax=Enterococcus sp. DIV0086 TaxID=2774655 RepID=UPI003D2B1EB9
MTILCVDVGGSYIKWGIIDDKYQILISHRVATPKNNIEEFIDIIEKIYQEQSHYDIQGIGFSLPGTMDTTTGHILHGGSIRYFDNVNFFEKFSHFHLNITIENDARCALIAEKELGTLKDVTNGLVFILGTGVGGGILINNQVYRGANLYAGEFSLIKPSGATNNTFLGNELSIPGLVGKVKNKLSLKSLSGEEMMTLIQKGNEETLEIYDAFIKRLVDSLISLQFIFAPEKIAIGGGISKNVDFITEVKKMYYQEISNIPLPVKLPFAELAVCDFHSDANLVGAYLTNKYKQTRG